ncbi:MAG TPA: Tm-1-like ATP-binding domain-containing protein [Ensifer sp.]|nr:Tm-1-like ATP-binding domain-containing protein [Ensifer sp.]
MQSRSTKSVTILLVGTADTKAEELVFLRNEIEALGQRALIMDVGVLGQPAVPVDIDHDRVAEAAGMTIAEIAALGEENLAMQHMAKGAAILAENLCRRGDIDGVLVIGGTMGTDLGLEVTKALPLGVAKLIVSSISFSHIIPPERVAPDLMMVLWAGGLWGLNTACCSVLRQAAGAIVGSAIVNPKRIEWAKPAIGISSLGSSCLKYLGRLKPALEARGYEVVVFHTVGLGGRALESLVEQGRIAAVFDLSLIEVSNHALGSPVSAGPTRLEAAGRMKVPQIVAPGAIDSVDLRPGDRDAIDRASEFYAHNRLIGGALTSAADKVMIADVIAAKLNRCEGRTAFVMPLQGVNEWDRPGAPMHDPRGLEGFVTTIEAKLKPKIEYRAIDAHINDPAFSDALLDIFDRWVAEGAIVAGMQEAA